MSIRAGLKFRACPIKGIGNGWLDVFMKIESHSLSLENATGKSEKHTEYRFVKPDGTIVG
jgi:hypothetical protein